MACEEVQHQHPLAGGQGSRFSARLGRTLDMGTSQAQHSAL